jgi:hypothetical protein
LSDDSGIVLSLLDADAVDFGFEDLSRLVCCSDFKPCRDFVHCLWFRVLDGDVVLVWRCPRFKKVVFP